MTTPDDDDGPTSYTNLDPHSVLRLWVAALESGEYRQTQQRLRGYGYSSDDSSYCCLGVLCDVSQAGSWDNYGTFSLNRTAGDPFDGTASRNHVPPSLRTHLGISASEEGSYINMNDSRDYTFAQIAAEIRELHPDVFARPRRWMGPVGS